MTHTLILKEGSWEPLKDHLLQNDVEQAAIVFGSASRQNGGICFREVDCMFLAAEDFEIQSAYHIQLTDAAQARIIKAAWDKKLSIIEFHSHVDPRHNPRFSPSDLHGFRDFIPHVWWRLRGQPYAAIVVARRGIDCLTWTKSPHTPEALSGVSVDGNVLMPTGNTIQALRRNDGDTF